ncbi:hypothetical protein L198_02424 [Cryptococcus wingfieldii CBS 7118]|uniref:DUF7727 domain-containing protein n=1 Tax=Cryptococcus wingfieldii CBS 7118 TaxID=1295528 RepID=A0A1E3JSD4_9TREE|nr:hypothetical protein L198_02424 [Cryptococcus wingfieldii CBS 7118]ODO03576.1 hypothetical protein L198_02424 [Cryptococcus wingfieldii CBS 7118]
MGALIWHVWGRLLGLTAGVYIVWASFWAFLFRKFFWDMMYVPLRTYHGLSRKVPNADGRSGRSGGTLGHAGIIPGKNTEPLVNLVVNIPLLQSFSLVLGIFALVLEYPLPLIEGTAIHRSFILRAVLYFLTGFVGIMVYQCVDPAVYFVIVSGVYVMAMSKGEQIGSGPGGDDRGKV